jgi:hypothetical protein
MPRDDERPEGRDRPETERTSEPRKRTQRLERQADPFPAPMTPSRN